MSATKLNTQKNRLKFVKKFGCEHPDAMLDYAVDDTTASIILKRFEERPEEHRNLDFFVERYYAKQENLYAWTDTSYRSRKQGRKNW